MEEEGRPKRKTHPPVELYTVPDEPRKKPRRCFGNRIAKVKNIPDCSPVIPKLKFLPDVRRGPAPLGCCKPPHPKVTTKDESVPCWRYSPCETEYYFYDKEGLTKRGTLTSVSYNEKAITFFANEKFISYTYKIGDFAKPTKEKNIPSTNPAEGFKEVVTMLNFFVMNEREQRRTCAIINACESTDYNCYATYFDDGRRCINVDLPVDHPVYLYFLRILQLQIDLGIADPGTVIVNAFGNTGIIIMQKKLRLNDQMAHCDCPSDLDGYIPYLSTTTDAWARKNYKPELGHGCLSCFVTLKAREDYLGNPGQGPHCMPGFATTVVGGNCLHHGTGNDRGEDEWKLFAHFDSPGFNRGKNVVRDKVFVSAMYSVIRQNYTPYTHCSSMMMRKYMCQDGCLRTSSKFYNEYNYYTYPYCNTCIQHRFHVKLDCGKRVDGDENCNDCTPNTLCNECSKNSNLCADYHFTAQYTGTKTLRDGDNFNGMEIRGGIVVTEERYHYLHRDLQGKMIDAIQVSEGEDPLFLDCTQLKAFLACFEQSSNIQNCNIIPQLSGNNVIKLFVRGKIKTGKCLIVYNPGKRKMSSKLLTEFNIDLHDSINKTVIFIWNSVVYFRFM